MRLRNLVGYLFFLSFLLMISPGAKAQHIANYLQLGKTELSENHYLKAVDYLNKAIQINSASYEGYFLRGIAKYSLGDYTGAERDFTDAIARDPYYAESYHYRAVVRSQQYNFGGALEDFNLAIERDPKNAVIYLNRGRTYLFLKQFNNTIKDCDKAIELKYKTAGVYILRGMAESGLEKYDDALSDFDRAVKYDPKDSYPYIQKGVTLMAMKKADSAIVEFNTALEIDSVDSYAIFNRALAKMETSDTTGAMNDLNKVIQLSPYNSMAYYNRAILQIKKGDMKAAISDLDRVIALNPDNIAVYLFRGQLKQSVGDLQGALKDFDNAINIYPDFADAYFERSRVKKQLLDFKGSEEDYKMAYSINKFDFENSDSLKIEEVMYLKRLMAFSGEFSDKNTNDSKIENENVDIDLKSLFGVVLFSNSITGTRMYDTYGKKGYHTTVVTLKENNEDNTDDAVISRQIKLFTDKIESEPYNPVNYYNRGLMLACSRDFEKAISDFDKAIMFDPDYTMAYFCRANTRYKLIELIKSYYDYKHPFNPVGNKAQTVKRDTTYIKQAYNKVISDYNKVERLDPGFYFTYYNKGYVKSLEGDYWGAVSDFSKAIKYDEKFAEAYYNRGLMLLFLKMNNRACSDLSTAGELGVTEAYRVIKRYCSK